jgi:hypothetical protein
MNTIVAKCRFQLGLPSEERVISRITNEGGCYEKS